MIMLASNWDYKHIDDAIKAFDNISTNYEKWEAIKYKYLDFFIEIKELWEDSKYSEIINVHNELFSKPL